MEREGCGSANIFLVAENRLLREALTKILNKRSDMVVVATASYSSEVFSQIVDHPPHVLMFDSVVLGLSNAHVVASLRKQVPELKVLLIGMDEDPEIFLATVRAGAVGYVLKDASALEVVAAVRSVVNGEAVCPPRLCLALFDAMAKQTGPMPSPVLKMQFGLTRREQQLVQMMSGGLTNKEISNEWNISEQTVKNHVHRVLHKLGATDRFTAVELCREQGWSA